MIFIAFLIGADIGWHIWEYKERRRLNENWDDLFNTKLESDNRWHGLCCRYLETIMELRAEIEKLNQKKKGNKNVKKR